MPTSAHRSTGPKHEASFTQATTAISVSSSLPRNPTRLAVTQRSSLQETPNAGPSKVDEIEGRDDDLDLMRRAEVKRAQTIRRIERWRDRLMEETVDRATFKKVTSQLTPPQYAEIAHERHLNSLCSYGLCPNPPFRPYSIAKRYVISSRARTIKPAQGNEDEGYCSKKCELRSSWVGRSLSAEAAWLRTDVNDFKLLEELEESGEFIWVTDPSTPKKKPSTTPFSTGQNGRLLSNRPSAGQSQEPNNTSRNAPRTPLAIVATEVDASSKKDSPVVALIANLTIHERPTPVAPPTPPCLTPSKLTPVHQASPLDQPQVLPLPSPQAVQTGKDQPARDSRRTQTSLISTSTSGLANTLISATKSLGPVHLTHGQGEDSDEEQDEESDWEKDMAWGEEDEEMRQLFEEARLARDLIKK